MCLCYFFKNVFVLLIYSCVYGVVAEATTKISTFTTKKCFHVTCSSFLFHKPSGSTFVFVVQRKV